MHKAGDKNKEVGQKLSFLSKTHKKYGKRYEIKKQTNIRIV